jgi:hypothetical protein
MNILTSSRILFDKTGRLKEIVDESIRIKQAGPPPAIEVEILMGRSFFRHRMAEVKRHLARPESQGLSRVMMDLMFNNAVFAVCKSHRMWATKLDRM